MLVEEVDYKSTTELFAKKGDDKTLDNFIPKSESDFLEFAELISHKLHPHEKSYHYIALLRAVIRLSVTSLKAAGTKDIASSITTIANEKLKAEKEATSKTKTCGKKKQLHVDKPDDDLVVNAYDDMDGYSDEYTSTIPPARLFKALIVDSHNLIPKLMPLSIKSIEITGDGGAGSIRQINFAEGSQVKYIKNRVDELDEKNFSFKYSLIEGDGTMDKLEKITYEVKFESTPDGGSKSKMTSTYYTKGDFELTEEEVKAGKDKALAMYKVVEGYLLQNPEAYVS
ncbi:hypothetical protein V6N13_091385 [Hibiscus sabdariffa]|uniref:Bet v I/Major latex protein domain-containing protein n=1 Tax=Hibiscus sabdariffa TaxID=183260 RepID=A0ABR2QDQ3_9ROSI